MGLLSKSKPPPDYGPKLAELERRLTYLEDKYKAVDVEWSEWFEKYRRLYARLAKRESDAKKRDGEPLPESDTPGYPPVSPLAARLMQGTPLLKRKDE